MQQINISPIEKLADSFLGRLTVTALTATVATMAIPLIFLTNSTLPAVVLRWSMVVYLGLSVGIAGRGMLNRSAFIIRLLSSWVILLGCFWLAGILTYGYVGFDILPRSLSFFDKVIILQIAIGGLVTWLTLYARRKPLVRVAPVIQPASTENRPKTKTQPAKKPKPSKPIKQKNSTPKTTPALPALSIQKTWKPNLKKLENRFSKWQHQAQQSVSESRQKAGALWLRSRKALRLRKRASISQVSFPASRLRVPTKRTANPRVHLVGKEEHRCPYCLELVEPNDPRGVKICPECHTYHHADCWSVTGACQVPHHHA